MMHSYKLGVEKIIETPHENETKFEVAKLQITNAAVI